jgi:tetrahydromethanopterin S-methyltransferase subunit B
MAIKIGPGAACIVGLSILACTPVGDNAWHFINDLRGNSHQLRIAPTRKVSNRELLAMVNQQLERSMEEMKTFVRDEVHTNAPSTVYINSSTPSYFTSFLKAGLLFGATYGLLRLSGFPIDNWLLVSRHAFNQMVEPLLEKIDVIRVAAEAGFETVLEKVQGYRVELQSMQEEVKEKVDKVDSNVNNVHEDLNSVSDALSKLDESMSITNQGMLLICSVVADYLPERSGLKTLATDSVTHRRPSLEAKDHGGALRLEASNTRAITTNNDDAQPEIGVDAKMQRDNDPRRNLDSILSVLPPTRSKGDA